MEDRGDGILMPDSYAENALVTLGDLFFLFHDWMFTEQYIAASLNLPIIIKIFEQDGQQTERGDLFT